MTDHRYSTFALDLYWVSATRDPEVARHVAECDQCGAYVAHLDALEARPLVVSTPRRRWWVPVAFAFAVAAIIAIVVWARKPPEAPWVAAKGAPAVQVLVHRAATTTVWAPAQPIHAGDALALQIACEAMPRATVLVADHGRWRTAYAGDCTTDVLPFSLTVDNEPGAERIAVVLSTHPLDDLTAASAADAQTRSAEVWALAFVFTKEIAP